MNDDGSQEVEISCKRILNTQPESGKTTKTPRCSDRITRLYRSKERLLDASVGAKKEIHDRRAIIQNQVEERLGKNAGCLRCERYLRDAIYRWLLGSARTPASWGTYLVSMTKWVEVSGKRSLSAQIDTRPAEIMDFLYALEAADASKRTIVLRRDVLRSWFAWLIDRDLLNRSPVRRDATRSFRADHNSIVKASGVRQALTQEQAQTVVAWSLTKAKPLIGFSVLLQLIGALRSDEVAKLEARHLASQEVVGGADRYVLTVPGKGNRSRTIIFEETLAAAYRRYWSAARRQGTRGALLRAPGGGHFTARTIQAFAKLAAAIIGREVDISSHDLRRSAATLMMENGAQLFDVQRALGHASPAQTARAYVVRRKGEVGTGLVMPVETIGGKT